MKPYWLGYPDILPHVWYTQMFPWHIFTSLNGFDEKRVASNFAGWKRHFPYKLAINWRYPFVFGHKSEWDVADLPGGSPLRLSGDPPSKSKAADSDSPLKLPARDHWLDNEADPQSRVEIMRMCFLFIFSMYNPLGDGQNLSKLKSTYLIRSPQGCVSRSFYPGVTSK